jgi:hypothetical protein
MENRLENKAKFFAQYYGQKVLRNRLLNDQIPPAPVGMFQLTESEYQYLELKSISEIVDDDFLEVMWKIFPFQPRSSFKKGGIYMDHLNVNQCDYLRSKGYALPFMEVSVEKLVEYGWVRLKGDPKP